MALRPPQKSLASWGKQKWRTASGKPSTQGPKATGERYLPANAIKTMPKSTLAATNAAKKKGTKAGKQYVPQPKAARTASKKHRKV